MRLSTHIIGVIALSTIAAAPAVAFGQAEPPAQTTRVVPSSTIADPGTQTTGTSVASPLWERLNGLVAPPKKKPELGTAPTSLGSGIIGISVDERGQPVLHTTKDADTRALRGQALNGLTAAAADTALEVVTHDATQQDLQKAWRAVTERAWTDRTPAFVIDLDPASGSILVSHSDLTEGEIEALRSLAGEHVTFEKRGEFVRTSRFNDDTPHWGGAGISRSLGGSCSAGFSVRGKTSGTPYSLTAAHCGPNGTRWFSGAYFYGETAGVSGYPDYDQARLGGSTYTTRIYTDQGEDPYGSRLVTGAADGSIGGYVCQAGASSGSICGIRIISLSATACDGSGDCTTYLGRGRRNGSTLAQGGDSGGPVYYPNPNEPRANIRGTVVGGEFVPATNSVDVFWERYESISNHLNVTIAAAP